MKSKGFYLIVVCVVLLIVPVSVCSQTFSDEQLIEAFKQNPYRASAGHTPYEAPINNVYTPAPKGYKAVYISHYGRHGSRYQSGEEIYKVVCSSLDEILANNLLTASGDSLRRELYILWDAHKNHMGGMYSTGINGS